VKIYSPDVIILDVGKKSPYPSMLTQMSIRNAVRYLLRIMLPIEMENERFKN
jgi:hypothetical protein